MIALSPAQAGAAGPERAALAACKRVLERWQGDPAFRRALEADPEGALAGLGVDLGAAEASRLVGLASGEGQGSPRLDRFRAFQAERGGLRARLREAARPASEALARWRERQLLRCRGTLGPSRADQLVHAPAAFELSSGCSVGCWFCAVGAAPLAEVWAWTPARRRLWRQALAALREVVGEGAGLASAYWATEPLDNPDYERYLEDFHELLGRWPSTTTALAARQPERVRRLLARSAAAGGRMDRLSILSLGDLERVHRAFSPEELLEVELVLQHRQAAPGVLKVTAGRALEHRAGRRPELTSDQHDSTIACVTGFLFRMPEGRVQLITPCPASPRWPLGYRVLGEVGLEEGGGPRAALEALLARALPRAPGPEDPVRLRPDLRPRVEGGRFTLQGRWEAVSFPRWPAPAPLLELAGGPPRPAEAWALALEREAGVPLGHTWALILELFHRGLLDEEPPLDHPGAAPRSAEEPA